MSQAVGRPVALPVRSVSNDAGYGPGFPGALERVAFDWMKSFSRQTEAAFAFANALKQPAEFN
jgi:hypothetical protein